MKRAVIFDFDGTIADSFTYVYQFLCEEAGTVPSDVEAKAAQYRGLSMKDMALKLGIPFWRLPFLYFKGRRVMREHLMQVPPFKDMLGVISELAQEDYRLFIVSSNSVRNIRNFLRHHEVAQHFTGILGNAGIFGKVSIIRQVLLRYRVSKVNCCYVGDEVGDMLAAQAVGVRAVAVTWGFASIDNLKQAADVWVNNPQDLLAALKDTWKK